MNKPNESLSSHDVNINIPSSTNKSKLKGIFILTGVFVFFLILLASIGIFCIIVYFKNKNIKTCVNDNLFNSSSNFSNTYIHAIQ
jgi:hypothetical protein